MPYTYTSDELVAAVKVLGKFPNATSTTAVNVLQHLSSVLQTVMAPAILNVREEYYVTPTRMATIAGTSKYRLPARAMGSKLRDVYLVRDGQRVALREMNRDDLSRYGTTSGSPGSYYIDGNNLVLIPVPDSTDTIIEYSFYFRPSDLVPVADTRRVAAVDVPNSTVTLDSAAPAGWGTGTGLAFDIHSWRPSFEVKAWNMTSTGGISGTTMVFDGPLDGGANNADGFKGNLAVVEDDYICLAGEAAIPYLPRDFHPTLVRGACMRISESDGDAKMAQLHGAIFGSELKTVLEVIGGNRVDSRSKALAGDGAVIWS